jgi:hypothetical protein
MEVTPSKLKQNLINNLMASADSRMRLGRLDQAEKTYQQVLFFDGFNSEARAKLEQIRTMKAEKSSTTLRITELTSSQAQDQPEKPEKPGLPHVVASGQGTHKAEDLASLNKKLETFDRLINSELSKRGPAKKKPRKTKQGKKAAKKKK